MTGIGRSEDAFDPAASPTRREGRSHVPRMHALLESLTHSLDLACRGYLCAPLVDCDPQTDPECGPTGKKLQFPDATSKAAEQILGAESSRGTRPAGPDLLEKPVSLEKPVLSERLVLEEKAHEGLPRK
jgi:hypothetical protein